MQIILPRRATLAAIVLLASSCGHGRSPAGPGIAATCDPARDRTAIASMAGEYDVRFTFEETTALVPGYQPTKPYRTGASEFVTVVEDTPERVSLQHILVVGEGDEGHPIKHWRQDWTFQDRTMLEFKGGDRWEKRALGADESRCTWTQAVYEVNDSPRYEGWGRFVHTAETSTWTSNETWRPLPRRERTREDYDVLLGINRHVMSPIGWIHEQDNTKLALRGTPHGIVKERGLNLYRRREPGQSLGVARAFWKEHADFWKDVRTAWSKLLDTRSGFTLTGGASGLYGELTTLEASPPAGRVERAEELLSRHMAASLAERGESSMSSETREVMRGLSLGTAVALGAALLWLVLGGLR